MVGRTGDVPPAVATPLTAPLYFGSNFAECPPILKVRLHDTTGYQTGWMFVYTMQPTVHPAVQLNSRL